MADSEVTTLRPADICRRLAAFGRDCVHHGDMTPMGERMLQRLLNDYLNGFVAQWHTSPDDGVSLAEFLGMSDLEYAVWTKDATIPGGRL